MAGIPQTLRTPHRDCSGGKPSSPLCGRPTPAHVGCKDGNVCKSRNITDCSGGEQHSWVGTSDYANQLSHQHWRKVCERMGLQMGLLQTWNILRSLVDPNQSKTIQPQNSGRLVREHRGTDAEILKEIKDGCVGTNTKAGFSLLPQLTKYL